MEEYFCAGCGEKITQGLMAIITDDKEIYSVHIGKEEAQSGSYISNLEPGHCLYDLVNDIGMQITNHLGPMPYMAISIDRLTQKGIREFILS